MSKGGTYSFSICYCNSTTSLSPYVACLNQNLQRSQTEIRYLYK